VAVFAVEEGPDTDDGRPAAEMAAELTAGAADGEGEGDEPPRGDGGGRVMALGGGMLGTVAVSKFTRGGVLARAGTPGATRAVAAAREGVIEAMRGGDAVALAAAVERVAAIESSTAAIESANPATDANADTTAAIAIAVTADGSSAAAATSALLAAADKAYLEGRRGDAARLYEACAAEEGAGFAPLMALRVHEGDLQGALDALRSAAAHHAAAAAAPEWVSVLGFDAPAVAVANAPGGLGLTTQVVNAAAATAYGRPLSLTARAMAGELGNMVAAAAAANAAAANAAAVVAAAGTVAARSSRGGAGDDHPRAISISAGGGGGGVNPHPPQLAFPSPVGWAPGLESIAAAAAVAAAGSTSMRVIPLSGRAAARFASSSSPARAAGLLLRGAAQPDVDGNALSAAAAPAAAEGVAAAAEAVRRGDPTKGWRTAGAYTRPLLSST